MKASFWDDPPTNQKQVSQIPIQVSELGLSF